MTGMELIRLPDPLLRDLREAWATGKRVALVLTDAAGRRIEGHVRSVSPSGVAANVGGVLVPLSEILSVHHPRQYMGDETTWKGGAFDGRPRRQEPQREQLPNPEGWESAASVRH